MPDAQRAKMRRGNAASSSSLVLHTAHASRSYHGRNDTCTTCTCDRACIWTDLCATHRATKCNRYQCATTSSPENPCSAHTPRTTHARNHERERCPAMRDREFPIFGTRAPSRLRVDEDHCQYAQAAGHSNERHTLRPSIRGSTMRLKADHIARNWRQRCLMFALVRSEPLRQFSICHAEPPVQGNATQMSTGQCARAHSSSN